MRRIYDETGCLIKDNNLEDTIEQRIRKIKKGEFVKNDKYVRIKFLEKIYFKYKKNIGSDLRSNFFALGLAIICFPVIFISQILYEERHLKIENKAKLAKGLENNKLYNDYIFNKYNKEYNIFEEYTTF